MNQVVMPRRIPPAARLGAELRQGLVSYWPLDEPSGTRRDAFGANRLTDNNTVTGNPGPFPVLTPASQFTSANSEYLSITDNASLSMEGTDFSFFAWVYLDTVGANRGIAAKDDNSAGNREWFFRYNNATTLWNVGLQNSTTSILAASAVNAGTPATTTWYFVGFTYEWVSRLWRFYRNGVFTDVAAASGDISASGASQYLGASIGHSTHWNGRIAGASLWKRALAAAEVNWLYNCGYGRSFPWR